MDMRKAYPPDAPERPDIRLPDGRRIPLTEIRNQVRDYRLMNIRSLINVKPKYTAEDRAWIAQSTPEGVMERFRCSRATANNLIYVSRQVVYNLSRRVKYRS